MASPTTFAEAEALGFKPVAPKVATERYARAKSRALTVERDIQVDCSTCDDNTPCDTVVEDGKITVYLCKGGACSHSDALERDLD